MASPESLDTKSSLRAEYNGYRNRLGLERSPYLLQHANNPVNWYAWGEEAFNKAKQENKPIFLSVGYSTCHWCHVMERESFESEEIGKILNDDFVAIKVDREERPDVDRVYMTFVQITQGGGGWPMSVWLTPDLKPFVGGTYFPPDDGHFGRPGFKTVLNNIAKSWRDDRASLQEQGDEMLQALVSGHASVMDLSKQHGLPHSGDVSGKCYAMLARSYDTRMGGFGRSPKFPQPVNLNLLLRKYASEPTSVIGRSALDMTLNTLRMMAKGGIHDHVGQGFHRYSTDGEWHVPHFEKMLYDQAQLAVSYAEAYQITKDDLFAEVLRDILSYVSRDLSDKSGGFYSAEDADSLPTQTASEKKEGAFCVWTYAEIYEHLRTPLAGTEKCIADVFAFYYNVIEGGNVDPNKDPHNELKKQNVLIVKKSLEETSNMFSLSQSETRTILESARAMLWEQRLKRPKPHLDNKIVTAWNGLMISGFSRGGQSLNDNALIERARSCAEFIRTTLYQPSTGLLLRSCYVDSTTEDVVLGQRPVEGFVDDYAMLIRGLLDLYEACFDENLLTWANELQKVQDSLFLDVINGGYFTTTTADPSIVLRLKEDQDGAEPSSNSVSAHNLLRLASLLDRPDLREQAVRLMTAFTETLERVPIALPEMTGALMLHHASPKQIIICGAVDAEDTQTLIRCIRGRFLPNKVLLVVDSDDTKTNSFLRSRLQILSSLTKKDGLATAYVCENYACKLPVNSAEELEKLLS